ncbi:hypothetical protein [Ferrimonas pelagia]|uniref:Uncharacterized protein n=1 Tax=Ferrimonas pelagia TaxID=1177826 RepID=A0ABP9E9Z0_9GAMM
MLSIVKKHTIFLIVMGWWSYTLFSDIASLSLSGSHWIELILYGLAIWFYLTYQSAYHLKRKAYKAKQKDATQHASSMQKLAPYAAKSLHEPSQCHDKDQRNALKQLKKVAEIYKLDLFISLVDCHKPYLMAQLRGPSTIEVIVTEGTVQRHGWLTLIQQISHLLAVRNFSATIPTNEIEPVNFHPNGLPYINVVYPLSVGLQSLLRFASSTQETKLRERISTRRLKRINSLLNVSDCDNFSELQQRLDSFLAQENSHWHA